MKTVLHKFRRFDPWNRRLRDSAVPGDPAWAPPGSLAVYAPIISLLVGIFIADLLTPLGIAVWVIYLTTAALSFFLWHPWLPPALAATSTGLILIGFFASSAGVDPGLALLNRSFAVVTLWLVAVAGYVSIAGKLQVRRQEWLQAGQVGLAERMAGNLTLAQLGDNVLRYLAERLDAQAGVMLAQDGTSFRRCAAYAIPPGSPIAEEVMPGEGLIGQAIKDRRAFLVGDLPDGYLYYGSGLGKHKPRHVLIAPVIADGEVNGVIEFGFAGSIGEGRAELLSRMAPAIGIALKSVRYRARLQELVEETQRQAEELQASSDRLRATNEELEAQSRALEESQAQLEQQQSELEQTNTVLTQQTQILEAQRDELERSQAALQARTAELEQASRYKSEFLANMSHELRTPLNSSLILARLLAENRAGNLTPEQVKYAETIESAGNDLLTLINDILDLSKIEAGRIDIHPQRVAVAGLVDKLARRFRPMAEARGLSLRVDVAPGTTEQIETDPQRLEQVLTNFLSNAIKFTEAGEVVIAVGRVPDGRVRFAVRDTGIGIAPAQHQVIFEAFRQADGTTNRKYGGTGLGLSIARELARLLGGEIVLDSMPGRGSTFSLYLPEIYEPALAETPERRTPAAPPCPCLRARTGRTAPRRHARVPSMTTARA